jgi:hypothetical protein
MLKRIVLPTLSHLVKKHCLIPKSGRIINLFVLVLLLLSFFLPALVNPGAVHAVDPPLCQQARTNYDGTVITLVFDDGMADATGKQG